ncbi:hypothetical protein IPZ58_07495 [Streptomyces roseoverticillatus]|uniref:hypothetical protein n=1 Tax=Streptomyces roseoverticillatus TaxID=66429 RepID=UPI001F48585C|nr:hypothetical protein [Streptomyces roseoverticillatus]MCF3101423.1 hypothetical protein [Streptomyces roseoverticillatus]
MAKQSGLGDNFYIAGYDLSGDIGSLGNVGGGMAPIEVTGIDKSAQERIGGRRDGRMTFSTFFNPATDRSHLRLSSLPTTDVIATYFRGTTLGNPSANIVAKQIGYDGTRDAAGALTFAVEAQANGYGLEWGRSMTAGKRTDTGATNGTSVDFGTGSTAFGLQAYLHVFAFTGTDATIKIQESSDDGAGDAWADVTGGAFTQVTAGPTSQRIATASGQTVERYLRVITATTGGFSSLTFAVSLVRNATAVSF